MKIDKLLITCSNYWGGGGVENYRFFSFRSSNSAHQKDFNALLGLRGIDRLSACFNERTIELYTNLMLAL